MIPVTVLDVVTPDPEKDHRILVLTDENRRRLLAVWIGPHEAADIALSLQEKKLFRPMTFSFMADLLGKADVRIESVAVSALENETFFATVHALNGDGKVDVDARPSDAIALAMRTQSPIFVAGEVMEAAGLEIPADMEVSAQGKRPKMSELFPIDPEEKERMQKEREEWESMSPEERSEVSRRKLLTHLTRSGTLSQSGASEDE